MTSKRRANLRICCWQAVPGKLAELWALKTQFAEQLRSARTRPWVTYTELVTAGNVWATIGKRLRKTSSISDLSSASHPDGQLVHPSERVVELLWRYSPDSDPLSDSDFHWRVRAEIGTATVPDPLPPFDPSFIRTLTSLNLKKAPVPVGHANRRGWRGKSVRFVEAEVVLSS